MAAVTPDSARDLPACCEVEHGVEVMLSTAAAGMHKVLGFVAVHMCWVAAELSEGQRTHSCSCSDKQGCFQLALHL